MAAVLSPMLGFLSFDRFCARRCCGPGRQWPPTGPSACCVGCSRCCGPRFRGRGFSSGSRGLCDPGDLRFPGCGAPARLRRAMAKNAVLQRHAESAMQVARAQSEVGSRRARLYRHPLRRRHVGPRAPGRDQGRSRSPRRPRAAGQQPFVVTNLRQTPRFIYEKVYCARGDIENRIANCSNMGCQSTARAALVSFLCANQCASVRPPRPTAQCKELRHCGRSRCVRPHAR